MSCQNGAVAFTPTDTPTRRPIRRRRRHTVKPLGKYTLTAAPVKLGQRARLPECQRERHRRPAQERRGDAVHAGRGRLGVHRDRARCRAGSRGRDGKVSASRQCPTPPPIPPDDLPPLPDDQADGTVYADKLPSTWVNVRAYPDATRGGRRRSASRRRGDAVHAGSQRLGVRRDGRTRAAGCSRQDGKVDFTPVNAPNPAPIPHDDLPALPAVTPFGQFTLTKLPGTWVNVRAYPETADGRGHRRPA